jgi:hypothetical protein
MTFKKSMHIIKAKYLILGVSLFIGFLSTSSCSITEDNDLLASNDSLYSEFLNANLRINKDVFDEINENRIDNRAEGKLFTINNIKREQDILLINLSYSGGCKPSQFEIIWDGIVYLDEPCHMNLLLVNNQNGDLCEALITETIVVNLKELIGDVIYKDTCDYYLFSTFNSGENADVVVEAIN